jgi:glyoxylase-like metal-dependent hydrolase (beta-lactamase superfamily II)
VQNVAPGIFWLRMPLPFALDHINLWLLEDKDGWTIVDTGICRDEIKALWRKLLTDVMAKRPVKRIIATHFHPDHLGLAGWLEEECGAPLWMTGTEWLMGSFLYYDSDARTTTRTLDFYRRHGLSEQWLTKLNSGNRYRRAVSPPPTAFYRIRDGDSISIGDKDWRVIVGNGHAPEHACLYCEALGTFISGDQILPKITPNISVYASEPDSNPLGLYLESLANFYALPQETLVLPSHGYPFTGLHARLDYIHEHHGDHFGELLAAIDQPRSAAELIPVMFQRQLDTHQIFFAMGECLAHLAYLTEGGQLVRYLSKNGLYLFSRP